MDFSEEGKEEKMSRGVFFWSLAPDGSRTLYVFMQRHFEAAALVWWEVRYLNFATTCLLSQFIKPMCNHKIKAT